MDSDDEFGDLYSDVLVPLSASSLNLNPKLEPNPNFTAPSDQIHSENPNPDNSSKHALDSLIDGEPNDDWMPDNWDDDDNHLEGKSTIEPEVKGKVEIPGIIDSKDWDSDDSEDDLKIVLNDDSGMRGIGEIMEENKDNLVSFENNDYNQEDNNGYLDKEEDDLEKKEGLDTLNVNEAVKSGFGNFQQQQQQQLQQHSLFKYVRPGAPVVGPSVQIRPPGQPVGSFAGRGRGEWRPAVGQKSFASGWGNNNASRPFGGGSDFTLPSYKTIFEVDIEIFEEKTWRHPGVDISDYFNFGLDEENWKEYAKQLDQLRMQSTMQSKIRVYESGRSVQEYDPDLPPELAAAANHDISADKMNPGKIYNVQPDLNGQGRGSPDTPVLPVGRPIQVEISNVERMASVDTRGPRPSFPDVIIEVFSYDHLEDNNAIRDDSPENLENDLQGEKHNGTEVAVVDGHNDSEHYSHSPQNTDDHSRENFGQRENELFNAHHDGRSTRGPIHGRNTSAKQKENNLKEERTEDDSEPKKSPKQQISTAETFKSEPSTEHNDDNGENKLALDVDKGIEDDGTSDSISHSSRKHKLRSRIAPVIKDDTDNGSDDVKNKPSENGLQDGRWRKNDNIRRYANDHFKEPRHAMMDRKRIGSRAYDPYPNRVWEQTYPLRPNRGFERMREADGSFWREPKIRVNGNKDGSSRARERKDEDYHSRKDKAEKGETSRRKMENGYKAEREVEDRQRVKNAHDDHRSRKGVEKDNQIVDKRQRKVNDSSQAYDKKHGSVERSSRVHNGRSSVSDSQKMYKDSNRESTRRKNTYSEAGVQHSSGHGKRKHEDSTHRNEKASKKLINEEEKQDDDADNVRYKDENDRESKKGRSKMERWSSDIKEVDIVVDDDIVLTTNETTQKTHDNIDETAEKLKRRSMRFNTPLPSEKESSSKPSSEKSQLQSNHQNKAHAEADVKSERPARKRKWSSSN